MISTVVKNKKIKVVWLCYFTNQFVQQIIRPWRAVGEIAPWIFNSIPVFENDENIDLHIISQHEWISGYKTFVSKGVTYHFFNAGIPLIGRHWPRFFRFDVWSDYIISKMVISKIVNNIKPDIIHLRGAENEFCTAITQFHNKYPVLITIQGFIHMSSAQTKAVKRRSLNELRILKMFNHYGYCTETLGRVIMELNPNAILHWHDSPVEIPKPCYVKKKYDLVFFARVCKDKGIEDLLEAVSVIKKYKQDISLCVIGGGKLAVWKDKANKLDISKNVYWAGFLPTQADVYNMASTARISVLPTYHDLLPGTIIESLFLKLPVVAYNVGSIYEVNKNEEIISLVQKLDVSGLAKSIIRLLEDEELQKTRGYLGFKRAFELVSDNTEVKKDIMNAYNIVINDFKKS